MPLSVQMRADVDLEDSIAFPHDGHVLKNRLVKAAMVEGLSSMLTGQPNTAHYRLYKRWADAGFGMIISGNACVTSDHLGTPGDLRLPVEITDLTLQPWRVLAENMTRNKAIGILQLVHTGRQSVRCAGRLPFSRPLAPSSVRVSTNPSSMIGQLAESLVFQEPKAMTIEDIEHVIQSFVKGARLAYEAEFYGVQIHASHGYLLSSFLSPKTNKRNDGYGGSRENRLRIILEIIDRIRETYQRPFILGIKLNSTDYVEGGLNEEEALHHVEQLARHGGLDFIEISGGSYENLAFLESDAPAPSSTRSQRREAIFSAFASRANDVILNATEESQHGNTPLIVCTGGFRSRAGIQHALQEDGIDLVGIGRPAAADPEWIERLLQQSSTSTDANYSDSCIKYNMTGGKWLQKLVPLKIVGGGMMTLWHEMQMSRLGRGAGARPGWTFGRLLLVEFLHSAMALPLVIAITMSVLAICLGYKST